MNSGKTVELIVVSDTVTILELLLPDQNEAITGYVLYRSDE